MAFTFTVKLLLRHFMAGTTHLEREITAGDCFNRCINLFGVDTKISEEKFQVKNHFKSRYTFYDRHKRPMF